MNNLYIKWQFYLDLKIELNELESKQLIGYIDQSMYPIFYDSFYRKFIDVNILLNNMVKL